MNLYPEFIARFYDLIYDKVRAGVDNGYYLKNELTENSTDFVIVCTKNS